MDVIRWVVSSVGLENIASPFLTSHFMLVSYLIPRFKRCSVQFPGARGRGKGTGGVAGFFGFIDYEQFFPAGRLVDCLRVED